MKSKLCKGFTKAEAFKGFEEEEGFDPSYKNATKAWESAGCPVIGTKDFNDFAEEFISTKRLPKGTGAHIVLEQGVADKRERPYKVHNIVTTGPRKFKRFYQVVEITDLVLDKEGNVKSYVEGIIIGKFETKGQASDIAREYTSAEKASCMCKIVEEPIAGEPNAFFCEYTPSAGAKEGKFFAFGYSNKLV